MSVVSATVIVAGTMFPVPSNDVPPMVRAVAKAVAVAASVTAMLAVPSNDTPPMVRPVAKAVAVAARPVQDPDDPEALPVTLPVRGPEKAPAVQVSEIVTLPSATSNAVVALVPVIVSFSADESHTNWSPDVSE